MDNITVTRWNVVLLGCGWGSFSSIIKVSWGSPIPRLDPGWKDTIRWSDLSPGSDKFL